MLKKVVNTILSRFTILMVSFTITVCTTQFLKTEGRGEVSIIVASFTVLTLLCNFVGGPALVYLGSRHHPLSLLLPCYISAFVICGICIPLVNIIYSFFPGIIPNLDIISHHIPHLAAIAWLISSTLYNQNILIGLKNIKANNQIQLLQNFGILVPLIILFNITGFRSPVSYIYASYIGYGSAFIWSLVCLRPVLQAKSELAFGEHFRLVAGKGGLAQISNLLQFFNYRLAYYMIGERSQVGIYSVAVAVAESIWLLGRSIALVQMSEVSHGEETIDQHKKTAKLAKVCFMLSLAALTVFLLIPAGIYTFIFGKDFSQVKEILLWLSPGILALSFQFTISHHLSGRGIFIFNNLAAAAGLVCTILLNLWLIPEIGLKGAAITSSVAYIISTATLWLFFLSRKKLYFT